MLRSNIKLTNFLVTLLLLAFLTIVGHAQFRWAFMDRHSNGGTVAGAKVTLTSKETNQSQTTQASDDGFYRFTGVPDYSSIAVEKTGFKWTSDEVKVDAESIKGQTSLEAGADQRDRYGTAENTVCKLKIQMSAKLSATQRS
jgi:hypothetical protein